ncbi:MAG: nitroreductase family protein, partial [Dehalococcoidia bacterium]|nr:nitroreductase family protein [Dehalococcoidia bacterium]
AVEKSGETSLALDDSIRVRFHLIREGRLVAEQMTFQTGRRWLFGSAPHFIIATSEEKPLFMMNMGFRMEQEILYATAQGLGTCWIGGLFTEERIGAFLGLAKGERVIALTPLGYPDTSSYGRAIHSIVHLGAPQSRRRKPLEQIVFGSRFGSPLETKDGELLEVLECTRLAPSWTNFQPWRFVVDGKEIIAVADASGRNLSVRDGKHYYRLDVGIAMSHFFMAARELGWKGSWQVTGFDPAQMAARHAVPNGYEVLGIYRR